MEKQGTATDRVTEDKNSILFFLKTAKVVQFATIIPDKVIMYLPCSCMMKEGEVKDDTVLWHFASTVVCKKVY